jgi:hypothetical protein
MIAGDGARRAGARSRRYGHGAGAVAEDPRRPLDEAAAIPFELTRTWIVDEDGVLIACDVNVSRFLVKL